jgi:hypothetical protein
MRPRTEAAFLLGGLVAIAALVAVVAREDAPDRDRRASTFRTGPLGSQGLFEAGAALGHAFERFRQRPQQLRPPDDSTRTLFILLDPVTRLSPAEVDALVQYSAHADLLLAGPGAVGLMQCFGYRIARRGTDSNTVDFPGATPATVHGTLVATNTAVHRDSSRRADGRISECAVPPVRSVTPLLSSPRGDVALRLQRADVDHAVILVADANLFRNRTVRETGAGPFALGLLVGGYDLVMFDEYHHGYGPSGSLGREALAWSARSPWGWAVWQVAVVGMLALLAGAIRFGPIRRHRRTARRSSLEHVQALATALSAAGGVDEAVAAQVRGLRRRLSAKGSPTAGDWRGWLDRLGRHASTPATARAVAELQELAVPGQPRASVLKAANAAEDVWESLNR